MQISPISPIAPAWHRMVRILFKPFDITKWMALGFCAFLAHCGEGGAGGGGSPPWPVGGQQASSTGEWFEQNMALVLIVAALVVVAGIGIALLVTWISSRGKFMFIDGVVKNRGAVREPWREYKREGNSLFLFRVVLGLLGFVAAVVAVGLPMLIAIPDFQRETLGGAGIAAIVVGSVLLLFLIVIAIAVKFMIDAFVVPTMYSRRVRALAGWRLAWRELVRGNIVSTIVLFLMLVVFGLVAAMIGILSVFFTCCLVIIPYVGTVILLPIPVFMTAYILEYIQQFGPEWQFFPDDMCTKCGYIKTEGSSATCPECGFSTAPTP